MYSHDSRQFSFSEFLLPFEGKLEANNRWVCFASDGIGKIYITS